MARSVSPAPGSIKGVLRGVITIAGSQPTGTATIAAVNTARTELRLLGWDTNQASAPQGNQDLPSLTLTNATTVTASRVSGGTSAVRVSWELTEFY